MRVPKNMVLCQYCNERFATRSNMLRHVRKSCKVKNTPKSEDEQFQMSDLLSIIKKQQEQIDSLTKNQQQHIEDLTKKQQEQIESLTDIIKNKTPESIEYSTTTNNNTVINNNIVYITDQLDYLEILERRFGTRDKSIEFIKNKLHNKLQGEIDVFSEIHLQGHPNTWPIRCPDKNKKQFYLVQPDNTMIPDPGGVTTHKRFYRNLQTAVLKLINQELSKVVDVGVGSDEYEELRDSLLDDFDLHAFQTRALEMSSGKPGSFLKYLMDEMSSKELHCH